MATPAEKLASSLEVLKEFQNEDGIAIIRASDVSRTHKDRLVSKGFFYKLGSRKVFFEKCSKVTDPDLFIY